MNCISVTDNLGASSINVVDNLAPPSNIFSIENGWFNPASISHLSVCGTSDIWVGPSSLMIDNIVCVLYFSNIRTVKPQL